MFKKIFLILMLGYSTIAFSATITDPPDFEWTHHPVTVDNPEEYWSGVLEYGEATFTFGGETLTTRAYRQKGKAYSIPGPTLRMIPGRKYVVQFENHSPYEPKSDVHNNFKDPNVTNVHTHGMHISPAGPSDDVLRFFEGGTGGDYVYDIPAHHMGGTYWYHAHHHGATFLQVATGALGSIVIDDGNDGLPANVAAMQEQNLVINFLDPTAAGTGGDTLVSGTMGPGWHVNGEVGGTVAIPPNTWQHWRVLVADPDADTWDLNIGSQCEVALMARDGVWRLAGIPKNLPTNSIVMNGASRSDLAVRCSADSEIRIDNTVVATIGVSGTGDGGLANPYAADGGLWYANRPEYLRDMRDSNPDNNVLSINAETVNMGARTINGNKFDAAVPTFDLSATDTQEWTIKGAKMHPFHLHVYHMQAQADCGDYEAGEFYDTISSSCLVRFDTNTATSTVFGGVTVMHCHILAHEDQGAMGWIRLSGSGLLAAPDYPAGTRDTLYTEYYSLGGGGEPPLPTSMLVDSVTVSTVSAGQGQKSGRAVVAVVDDLGSPVAGATVSGTFSGTYNETASGTTGADGSVTFDTSATAKGGVSFTFCVTDVTGTLTYSGPEVCGSL